MWAFKNKESGEWLYALTEREAECSSDRFIAFATRESAVLWFWGAGLDRKDFALVKVRLVEVEEADS